MHWFIGWAGRFARSLARDRRGSVYTFVGVALIPMVAAMGIAIDSARGYLVRSRLSQALDAAGLAGARVFDSANRDSDIRMFFRANFASNAYQATVSPDPAPTISADNSAGTLTLTATATIPTTFMRVVGFDTLTVHAESTITRLNREMELVLAMDNTGSMDDDGKMEAMQAAATELLNILYGTRDTIDRFHIGVVPFVSSVNVGSARTSWAPAITQGTSMNIVGMSRLSNSNGIIRVRVQPPANQPSHSYRNSDIISIGGMPSSQPSGNCINYLNIQRNHLVVVSNALSNTYGYNTTQLNSTTNWFSGGYNPQTDFTFRIPYTTGSGCTNTAINFTGATARWEATLPSWYAWRGCVEARSDPYEEEQAEATPTQQPFRRYFWQSTSGVRLVRTQADETWEYANWSDADTNEGDDYAYANNWTTSNHNTRIDPNRGCQDLPIVPLQPSRATAQATINAMSPTCCSFTHSNLGMAWAWRVLSPSYRGLWGAAGDTLPGDYQADLRDKVVVLLTDGRNTHGQQTASNSNNHNNYLSSYTAYGRLERGDLGHPTDSGAAVTEMNARVTRLCDAMKAQNIIIYTIVLQENDATTQGVFQNCATTPQHYFLSPTAADLNGIFTQIANELRRLRISR